MKQRTSFFSVLLALLLGALALLSPACDGCTCPLSTDDVLSCSDGSEVTLYKGTNITPTCACMDADWVPLSSLPDQACLPCSPEMAMAGQCLFADAESITAIDVTPDGKTLTPSAQLSFQLPTVPWTGSSTLYIFQHDPGATCNPPAQTSWHSVTTQVAQVTSGLDRAVGKFNHTCIFLLVDLRGDFNVMGELTRPVELEPADTLLVSLDVIGSSTHPELEGQSATFGLYGVRYRDGSDALLSLMQDYFPPGTMLLIHHETNGNTVIWSDRQVVQFDCEGVGW
jgi:hypothetical protein